MRFESPETLEQIIFDVLRSFNRNTLGVYNYGRPRFQKCVTKHRCVLRIKLNKQN